MLFYPAALPLSSQTLAYTSGIIRCHRRQIGSSWRKLTPGRQALLVLANVQRQSTATSPYSSGRSLSCTAALTWGREPSAQDRR